MKFIVIIIWIKYVDIKRMCEYRALIKALDQNPSIFSLYPYSIILYNYVFQIV